jgi:hypothetical protein
LTGGQCLQRFEEAGRLLLGQFQLAAQILRRQRGGKEPASFKPVEMLGGCKPAGQFTPQLGGQVEDAALQAADQFRLKCLQERPDRGERRTGDRPLGWPKELKQTGDQLTEAVPGGCRLVGHGGFPRCPAAGQGALVW